MIFYAHAILAVEILHNLELASYNTVLACLLFFTNFAGGYTRRILPHEHGSTGELSLRWGQVRYIAEIMSA
jgi:hypothetical protein